MKYKIRVLRVQTAEKTVRASDEDAALALVRAELDKPYSLLAWETKAVDVEIVGAEAVSLPGALPPRDGPLVLTVADAAEALGLSRSSVYELLRRGELRHLRPGKAIRIPRTALVSFVDANSSGPSP